MKNIERYWGYFVLVALIAAWFTATIGPVVLMILSGLVVIFALFQAPAWCGSDNRNGTSCRNNSYGLLLGCRIRQHKWQRFKAVIGLQGWPKAFAALWNQLNTKLATIAGTLGLISGIVASVKQLTA